ADTLEFSRDPDVERVLDFWFGKLTDGIADAATRQRWFASDRAFDALCTLHFAEILDAAANDRLAHWTTTPRGGLAFILVGDQFSRQIHRGSARAFATDARALACAKQGVTAGHDRELGYDERTFFYLLFEHSESRLDQHTAVGLFTQLAADAPPSHRDDALSS